MEQLQPQIYNAIRDLFIKNYVNYLLKVDLRHENVEISHELVLENQATSWGGFIQINLSAVMASSQIATQAGLVLIIAGERVFLPWGSFTLLSPDYNEGWAFEFPAANTTVVKSNLTLVQ